MVAGSYNVLIVHPSLPVKTVKDMVALAKSKPGQLNYASGGVGSAIHLAMELFASRANIDVVHIPYKGAGPALTDVLGGQVLTMFATPVAAMPYIKTGRLRPLGVSSLKRLAFLPDVPTIAESGYPGFEVNYWYGMLAPADTPRELVTRLNTMVNALLAMPDVKERVGGLGAEPQPGTPEQFAQRVSKEVSGWTQVLGKRRSRAQ
jgi:tripartite-type tricarboxylate transporter receptor subunit TctC